MFILIELDDALIDMPLHCKDRRIIIYRSLVKLWNILLGNAMKPYVLKTYGYLKWDYIQIE